MKHWLCAAVLTFGVPLSLGAAEGLDEIERSIREDLAQRDKLTAERQLRSAEAARLADEIAELKRRATGRPRADRVLEQRLRTFDRVALALDALDRRLRILERRLAQARSRFMARADAELAALAAQRGAASAAGRIEAITATQQRVVAITGAGPTIRPALDISLAPEDGLAEVRGKVALLQSERQRLLAAEATLEQELAVVATRLTLKRQVAREIEAANREAGVASSPLVQRETDNLLEDVRQLERQREALVRERGTLPREIARIDDRIDALARRARELELPGVTGESP